MNRVIIIIMVCKEDVYWGGRWGNSVVSGDLVVPQTLIMIICPFFAKFLLALYYTHTHHDHLPFCVANFLVSLYCKHLR